MHCHKRSLPLPDAESVFFFFALCLLLCTVPMDAMAGGNIQKTICKVADIFQGQAGRNVASLAIIIVGFGALMGKVSSGLCVIVCVGIALIFGSAPIVTALTGKTGCGTTPSCTGATGTELENVAKNAVGLITGKIGKAISTLAVVIVGLGAFYGKVSWPYAIFVGLGIALIFGSASILQIVIGC